MAKRKGATVVEVVVFVMIGIIVASLVVRKVGCAYYDTQGSGVYQCVKTYTVLSKTDTPETEKRVDLRPKNGGQVETMTVDDNFIIGQYNSATLYAQFEPGKWYNVEYIGYRREGIFTLFPLVTNVSLIEEP